VAVILDTNAISALLAGSEALGDLLDQAEHHPPELVVPGIRVGRALLFKVLPSGRQAAGGRRRDSGTAVCDE
jgi:predicted nucleic acid-binding protein